MAILPQKLRLGIGSLMLHKLRSALAVLGILIGVTAVIWLVAMGEGVSYQAQQQIKDLGATSIIVRGIKPPQERTRNKDNFFLSYGLLRDDYDRIRTNVPAVRQVVPMREVSKEVCNRDHIVDAKLIGCTPEYLAINHLRVERGRDLTDNDQMRCDNVAVLAHAVAAVLFPIEDPIGRAVRIDSDFYVVVGVMAERTAAAGDRRKPRGPAIRQRRLYSAPRPFGGAIGRRRLQQASRAAFKRKMCNSLRSPPSCRT